jgi:hypothetical protein
MSVYGVFETALVGAAVAAGGLSALRTFAPSTFGRLLWWKRGASPQSPPAKSAGCSGCGTCSGCAVRTDQPLTSYSPEDSAMRAGTSSRSGAGRWNR